MTLNGVTSFSRIEKLTKYMYMNGGKLAFFEGYPFRCHLCVRIEMVFRTSDLLPNISLVVGQPSVIISPALRAREISTLRLTSNQ